MEYGGKSLFDFIVRAHQLILSGNIDIDEWQKVIKVIFKQMIECIEFIHKHNICHFDISLENFLINDVQIQEIKTENNYIHNNNNNNNIQITDRKQIKTTNHSKIKFILQDLQIKLCDFGLAESFNTIKQEQDKEDNNISFKSNKWCGKPNYQSPEINLKKPDFNGKCNDIFCLGVCLFMMTIGNAPWRFAHKSDELFNHMFEGKLVHILRSWNKSQYFNQEWVDLMESIFKYEDKRITLERIKQHSWLKA